MKRPDFDHVLHVNAELTKLVGAEDANELDADARDLSTKYDELGRRCVQCGRALSGFSADMCNFLADTDELAEWLDHIEREFGRLEELPLEPQELVALSSEFAVSRDAAAVSALVLHALKVVSCISVLDIVGFKTILH